MNHLIVGCGPVGIATGTYLETINQNVVYYDINEKYLFNLSKEGKNVCYSLKPKNYSFEVYWICTPETEVEKIIKVLPKESLIVVRSTTVPGTLQKLEEKYKIPYLVHNPEFLREKTALEDTFNPDRIVLGGNSFSVGCVERLYSSLNCPKILVTLTESELTKQISNAWLATQISFWNEVKKLCDAFEVNPQKIANTVTLDKRISKYGSIMLGLPFKGKCLPKDLNNLLTLMKERKIDSYVLHSVRNFNDWITSEESWKQKKEKKDLKNL